GRHASAARPCRFARSHGGHRYSRQRNCRRGRPDGSRPRRQTGRRRRAPHAKASAARCGPQMMVNWKFAWREVRMRPSRAILTLLSIVIGVAAVVAVTIASGTTGHAFDEIYKAVAGKADL